MAGIAGNKFWTGNLSTDWNTAGNWTPAGVPTAGASNVQFDLAHITNNQNCTLSNNGVCRNLWTDTTYPGTLNLNGFTLGVGLATANGSAWFEHPGTLTIPLGSTISTSGSSTQPILHIDSALGAFNGGGSVLITTSGQGTGTLEINKDISSSPFLNLTITLSSAGNKTCSVIGTDTHVQFNGTVTITSGILAIGSSTLTVKCDSATPIVQTDRLTSTSGGRLVFTNGSQSSVTLGAMTMTGAGGIRISKDAASAITFGSSGISVSTSGVLELLNNEATNSYTFNTNGYAITGNIYPGSNVASTTSTINFRESVVTGTINGTSYTAGTLSINIGKASTVTTWNLGGNFIWNSNATITYTDIADITFNFNAASGNITSNGKTFPNINASGAYTFTQLDAINISGNWTNSATWQNNGYDFTLSGTYNQTGTSTNFTGGTVTQTGDADFTFGGTTITVTSCNLVLQGTNTLTLNSSNPPRFTTINCAASGKTTTCASFTDLGSGDGAGVAESGQLVLGSGILTLSTTLFIWVKSSNTPFSTTGGYTINGTGGIALIYETGSGYTTTIPALTMGGTTTLTAYQGTSGSGAWAVGLSGGISAPTLQVYSTRASGLTFNTNDYAIAAPTLFRFGNNGGDCTGNFGASAVTIGSFNPYSAGATAFNIGKVSTAADWIIKGNFTWPSNGTISYANAAQTTFTFNTNPATITSNGKSFPVLAFNQTSTIYTNADAFSCYRLQIKPDTTLKCKSAATSTISNYTAGDLDGTSGHNSVIQSSTDSTQATIANPVNMVCNYLSVKDMAANTKIISLTKAGCVNNGDNNNSWVFSLRRKFITVSKASS